MDHSSALAAILASPQGRAAVGSGDTGAAIRLIRRTMGWTQHDLAKRSGYSQATISRLERGVSRATRDTAVLTDLAEALGVPSGALGLASDSNQPPILADVDRREFLGGAIALAVAALLPQAVVTPGRINAAEVAQCWTGLRRLFELDDHQGGGTVYQVAEGMARRLQDALPEREMPGVWGASRLRVQVPMSDLFGLGGQALLQRVQLPPAGRARIGSATRVLECLDFEVEVFTNLVTGRLREHPGYAAIQVIPGIGQVLAAVFVAEIGDVTRFPGPAQLSSWAGLTVGAEAIAATRLTQHEQVDDELGRARGAAGGQRARGSRMGRLDRASVSSIRLTCTGKIRSDLAERKPV